MGQIVQPKFDITDAKEPLIYGHGACILESLQNLRIGNVGGSNDYVASMRFRATQSDRVTGIWAYFELATGYATGGGGTIRFRLVEDDGTPNHRPRHNGTVYAEGRYQVSAAHIAAGRQIGMFDLTPSRPLAKGQLYHIMMDNVASTSTERWASINCPQVRNTYGGPCRWFNNTDWAGMWSTNGVAGNWTDGMTTGSGGKLFAPMMAIRYAGGQYQGYTPMESGATDNRTWRLSSSTNRIREQYRSDYDRRICGMSLYATCQVAGSMRILIDINGRRAAQFSINATQTNYTDAPVGRSKLISAAWYDIQFPSDIFLPAGGEMNVFFVAEGTSVWYLSAQRNGAARGSPVAFTQSETQLKFGDDWRPFNIHNHSGSTSPKDTGLRMVMHVTPPYSGSSGGGGTPAPQPASGTFADFGTQTMNVVWIREFPNPSGENRWLIQFIGINNGGDVINNDDVKNIPALMADREWTGSRTIPAIVWTGGKDLPNNIRDYTSTTFTVDRANVRSVEPWHDVGIWHSNATAADRTESVQK